MTMPGEDWAGEEDDNAKHPGARGCWGLQLRFEGIVGAPRTCIGGLQS